MLLQAPHAPACGGSARHQPTASIIVVDRDQQATVAPGEIGQGGNVAGQPLVHLARSVEGSRQQVQTGGETGDGTLTVGGTIDEVFLEQP
ncbi:MAG: hypothetical protein VCF24_15795, partial [Candidatus Latescibacterota bacterium]